MSWRGGSLLTTRCSLLVAHSEWPVPIASRPDWGPRPGGRCKFSCEGETDCTAEKTRGQFNIFGAIEEMRATDSEGWRGVQETLEDFAASRMGRRVPFVCRGEGENRRERAGGLFTAGAQEMQKGSCQSSVASPAFPVLDFGCGE